MEDNRTDFPDCNTPEKMKDGRSKADSRTESGMAISLKGRDLKKMVIYSELMTPKFDG